MIRTMKGALAASAAFYAAHGAALAKPAVDLSSSEQAAMQACSSGKPFVVVDSFKITKTIYGDQGTPDSASMDFNGDLHVQGREFIGLDGTHGDLVAGITGANGRHVIPFQTVDIMPDDLAHAFTSLADALESGEIEKPGAVIASLVLPTAVEHMASLMPYKGPGQEVTLDTLAQRKDKIIRFLFKKAEDRNDPYRAYYQAYIRIYEAFKRIDALGHPCVSGGGQ
ncbi:MAG: hypothetical protein LRY62_01435 [Alphaproteobacteria bacterium]|nr:hypothetical protein [Alphaproteobacteria bacterium]